MRGKFTQPRCSVASHTRNLDGLVNLCHPNKFNLQKRKKVPIFSQKIEILLFATAWMDLAGIMLSEISQTERQITCIHSRVDSNEQSHGCREQTDRCQRGGRLGAGWKR